MKTLTKKEKLLWNEAILKAANEVYLYDGLIPEEWERKILKEKIVKKFSYKIKS
jgi:hypothetical protein